MSLNCGGNSCHHLDPDFLKGSLPLQDRTFFSICSCDATINVRVLGNMPHCGNELPWRRLVLS